MSSSPLQGEQEGSLPDILRFRRIVVNLLGAILQIIHVEIVSRIVQHRLELNIVCLVGIHSLTEHDTAQADIRCTHGIRCTGSTCCVLLTTLHEVVVAHTFINLSIIVVVIFVIIVTDIAGTTRDSIYTRYDKFGFDFYLVDTAGIRRKNKVTEDLEFYSVMRSIRAIENSDVCILMLDATRGIEAQDMNIFQLIQKNNKSLVVVVNKWDLVEDKSQEVIKTFENAIRNRMAPFVDFPIIFASALTKQRIFKVLETAKQVYLNRKAKIGTSKLNEVMLPLIEAFPPPSIKGKYIKIKYVAQVPDTQIPTFVFYANLPQYVKEPYKRFLENKIRENWTLTGSPINVFIRQK